MYQHQKSHLFKYSDYNLRICFFRCYGLVHIKWSIYLRRIEECSFHECDLSSGFMPPTCRYIGNYAFRYNSNLNIFKMPEEVQLGGDGVLVHTALMKKSPHFNIFQRGYGQIFQNWVRNLDREEEFSLHRACCSYRPLKEIIMGIVEERGLAAFSQKNKAGITPSKYLSENPYADISEMEIVRNYISKMMGELE
ncbi:predicted protein [Chaetoceros tenuissimus]|uniref:Uncharacterized protein n=1 Tax=Chaetoceros tenuissimus TaxID=426638 RepID=A0AAD3D3T7_9STRA|nr:predicted protein [Chaetoceros tenuissimus]